MRELLIPLFVHILWVWALWFGNSATYWVGVTAIGLWLLAGALCQLREAKAKIAAMKLTVRWYSYSFVSLHTALAIGALHMGWYLVAGLALMSVAIRLMILKHIVDHESDDVDNGYLIFKDSDDTWCATGPGFTCLATSPAGFGSTPDAALRELMVEMKV